MIDESENEVITLLFKVDKGTDLDQFLLDELKKYAEANGPILLIDKFAGYDGDDFVNNKITISAQVKPDHA